MGKYPVVRLMHLLSIANRLEQWELKNKLRTPSPPSTLSYPSLWTYRSGKWGVQTVHSILSLVFLYGQALSAAVAQQFSPFLNLLSQSTDIVTHSSGLTVVCHFWSSWLWSDLGQLLGSAHRGRPCSPLTSLLPQPCLENIIHSHIH